MLISGRLETKFHRRWSLTRNKHHLMLYGLAKDYTPVSCVPARRSASRRVDRRPERLVLGGWVQSTASTRKFRCLDKQGRKD